VGQIQRIIEMNKPWQYNLQNSILESYFVNRGSGDFVDTTITDTPLPETPEGWQDLALGWERNMQRLGVIRNFSVPLSFVKDGARILRKIFFTQNVETKVFLLIRKLALSLTSTTFKWIYNDFYLGEIDPTTIKVDDETKKVSASIAETGIAKLLKANENTTYEIPLEDPAVITVKMDGIYLNEKHNFNTGTVGTNFDHLVPCLFINKEGQAPGVATYTVYLVENPSISSTSDDFFLATSQAITGMELSGTFILKSFGGTTNTYRLRLKSSLGQDILIGTCTFGTTAIQFPWTVTFNAGENEHFWLYADIDTVVGMFYTESSFSLSYKSKFKTTYVNAFLPKTLFSKLSTKVVGSSSVISNVLDTNSYRAITCGDAVRNIAGARIKTSLNSFIEDCKVGHAAGFGIEGEQLVIEDFHHFLNEATPINLGRIKNLKTSMATDLMANTIKIGYPDKSIDDVNGKYEFNNTHVYTAPITRMAKEFPLVSPYAAQPYFIEITRINFDGKTTTDNNADNEVMIIDVEPISFSGVEITASISDGTNFLTFHSSDYIDDFVDGKQFVISGAGSNNGTFTILFVTDLITGGFAVGVAETVVPGTITGATVSTGIYKLKRDAFASITGIPDTVNIFNINESPKRLLIKHLPWINSFLEKLDGQLLKFQTTEKNANLVTDDGVNTITEKGDYTVGSTQLFKPFYFEFDTVTPVNLADILESSPNRAFSFIDNDGDTFIGFLIKASIAPDDNKEQSFKLLSSPSNDLSKFE
jgi:hypothetical protein